jgi:hypothetical protein
LAAEGDVHDKHLTHLKIVVERIFLALPGLAQTPGRQPFPFPVIEVLFRAIRPLRLTIPFQKRGRAIFHFGDTGERQGSAILMVVTAQIQLAFILNDPIRT